MFLFITWMFVQFEYFKYYQNNLDYIFCLTNVGNVVNTLPQLNAPTIRDLTFFKSLAKNI